MRPRRQQVPVRIFARPDSGDAQSARSRLTDVIKVDRSTAAAGTVAAEIATLKQKLAAAEARIRELEDKDNAFKPLTSWKSDKTKSTPTLDDLRERMAALNCEIAKRSGF
jgi:hypothetical protein